MSNTKQSIVLLEVIFSSIIIGILFFTSLQLASTLAQKSNVSYAGNMAKLDFEATREFLDYQLKTHSNTTFDIYSHLQYDSANKALMYDGYLLLANVESFNIASGDKDIKYTICIKPIKPISTNKASSFDICQSQVLVGNLLNKIQ